MKIMGKIAVLLPLLQSKEGGETNLLNIMRSMVKGSILSLLMRNHAYKLLIRAAIIW